MKWRLADTGRRSARENNTITETMLAMHTTPEAREGMLHFFQFDSSSVLVGCYQDIGREVRVDYCREQGIPIIRRFSGGGVAYVDRNTLGWKLIAAKRDLPAYPAEELSRMAGRAVEEAIREFGIDAKYVEPDEVRIDGRLLCHIYCMDISDSMMWEGYIPMKLDAGAILRALRIPTEKLTQKAEEGFMTRNTFMERECEAEISISRLKRVISRSFAREFYLSFGQCRKISGAESVLAARPATKTPTAGVDQSRYILRSRFRSEGRELTASLLLDKNGQQIQSATVTGDFYVYPGSAVTQLTNSLAGLPANEKAVGDVVTACLASVRITGFNAQDFHDTIQAALGKRQFIGIGARPHEVSHLYCVGGLTPSEIPELLQTRPLVFLLPYCAKLPKCKFRYTEGCVCCGRCDVGDGYHLAEQNELQPFTIQNYEMLEEALRAMKASGKRIFFGTCCEEFIDKHYQDFKRIGMPGLLVGVDNSTCYELGKDREAHLGIFENQTRLKIDLIERIIKCSA